MEPCVSYRELFSGPRTLSDSSWPPAAADSTATGLLLFMDMCMLALEINAVIDLSSHFVSEGITKIIFLSSFTYPVFISFVKHNRRNSVNHVDLNFPCKYSEWNWRFYVS